MCIPPGFCPQGRGACVSCAREPATKSMDQTRKRVKRRHVGRNVQALFKIAATLLVKGQARTGACPDAISAPMECIWNASQCFSVCTKVLLSGPKLYTKFRRVRQGKL